MLFISKYATSMWWSENEIRVEFYSHGWRRVEIFRI